MEFSRAETYSGFKTESIVWKWVISTAQVSIYPVLLMSRFILVRRNLIRADRVKIGRQSHVLYANHQSQLDPFLLCVSLNPRAVLKLVPFRFFVANDYFENPLIAGLLKILGGFPAHFHPSRPYGLDHAKQLMDSGQTLVIFPQGKRTTKKIAKPGISVIAIRPNVRLIPIKINWHGRLTCHIKVGQTFSNNTPKMPDELMKAVHEL